MVAAVVHREVVVAVVDVPVEKEHALQMDWRQAPSPETTTVADGLVEGTADGEAEGELDGLAVEGSELGEVDVRVS